jgi:hypothetical protein
MGCGRAANITDALGRRQSEPASPRPSGADPIREAERVTNAMQMELIRLTRAFAL